MRKTGLLALAVMIIALATAAPLAAAKNLVGGGGSGDWNNVKNLVGKRILIILSDKSFSHYMDVEGRVLEVKEETIELNLVGIGNYRWLGKNDVLGRMLDTMVVDGLSQKFVGLTITLHSGWSFSASIPKELIVCLYQERNWLTRFFSGKRPGKLVYAGHLYRKN